MPRKKLSKQNPKYNYAITAGNYIIKAVRAASAEEALRCSVDRKLVIVVVDEHYAHTADKFYEAFIMGSLHNNCTVNGYDL